MTITYIFENSIYINLTNKCTNRCDFCIRNEKNQVYSDTSLWLEREPSVSEVVNEIFSYDLSLYKEIVFCGYGEPLMRYNEVIEISKLIKEKSDISIRLNTNGHGNLIAGRDITPLLNNIDVISISLNQKNGKLYQDVCHSIYGEDVYEEILEFAVKCKKYVKSVIFSVVDTIPSEDIEQCMKICDEIDIPLRVRHYVK